jgi:hypothetical protein
MRQDFKNGVDPRVGFHCEFDAGYKQGYCETQPKDEHHQSRLPGGCP